MKIFFGTQTEGNGHLTQAIALKQYFAKKGQNIDKVFAANKSKGLSSYFTNEFNVIKYDGFDFVFDQNGRMVVYKTILKNLFKLHKIIVSFYKICSIIRKEKPDTIVNFYDPLIGLTALFFKNIKYISISHQYATALDCYPKINGFYIQKITMWILNTVTSINATKIALSYYKFNDSSVVACPPLLRDESYIRSNINENFILVYMMNEDMVPQVIEQAVKYPNETFEVFTKLTKQIDVPNNIKLFNLNGKLFQERMKVCKAIICSGGFETTSEAILQHKPVLMIPIPNHYEQYANCNDAALHGYATWNKKIDLEHLPQYQKGNDNWFFELKNILDHCTN